MLPDRHMMPAKVDAVGSRDDDFLALSEGWTNQTSLNLSGPHLLFDPPTNVKRVRSGRDDFSLDAAAGPRTVATSADPPEFIHINSTRATHRLLRNR